MKKCFDTNNEVHLAMFQIHSTSIGPKLPCPAALMLNIPIRSIMPKISQTLMLFNHDDDHYPSLIERQQDAVKKNTCKRSLFLSTGLI